MRTYRNTSLSLPPKMLEQITAMAAEEGKTKSEFIREALRQYIQFKELRTAQVMFSQRATELGVQDETDVERIIDEYRSQGS